MAIYLILGCVVAIGAIIILTARRKPVGGQPGIFPREEQEQTREHLDRLLADIQEVSRENIARLDARIRTLQQLLGEADARIKEIKGLVDRASPAEQGRVVRPANPLHERVYALADSGKAVAEIGAETGLEKGEVELILGLRTTETRKHGIG